MRKKRVGGEEGVGGTCSSTRRWQQGVNSIGSYRSALPLCFSCQEEVHVGSREYNRERTCPLLNEEASARSQPCSPGE